MRRGRAVRAALLVALLFAFAGCALSETVATASTTPEATATSTTTPEADTTSEDDNTTTTPVPPHPTRPDPPFSLLTFSLLNDPRLSSLRGVGEWPWVPLLVVTSALCGASQTTDKTMHRWMFRAL
ncbi:hypothetical protein T484DRAFT_1925545 [Baffinella frigidus]|nr:hypothetical protein T484DRAFT_1925545 [Cryptophyta sp. CCMP2293]